MAYQHSRIILPMTRSAFKRENIKVFSTKHSTREEKPQTQESMLSSDTEIVNLNQYEKEIRAKSLQKSYQRCLPSDKEQGISPQTRARASALRQGPGRFQTKRDQSISPQTWTRASTLRQGPWLLLPDRELLLEEDQGVSPHKGTRVSPLRKESECFPTHRDQGDFSQKKTRVSPLRDQGDFSQKGTWVFPH